MASQMLADVLRYLRHFASAPDGDEQSDSDLIEQVIDMCRYHGREPAISRELLDAACSSYFLEETDSQGAEA